jgi:hypothetical protein
LRGYEFLLISINRLRRRCSVALALLEEGGKGRMAMMEEGLLDGSGIIIL